MHAPPRDAAAKTYLFLRVGLISAAMFLAISVIVEVIQGWELNNGLCLQPSISSYYYTPVRAVFAGSLLIVSASLIAIQGDDDHEDLWLTFAGMLAPVVALVPTTNVGICEPVETSTTEAFTGVTNNFTSALIIGWVLWLFARFFLPAQSNLPPVSRKGWRAVGAVLLGFSVWFAFSRPNFDLLSPDFFNQWAHNAAAVLMFMFLFFAAALSANRCDVPSYKKNYRLLARAMVLLTLVVIVIAVIGVFTTEWQHAVFTLEAGEIVIFAIYWGIQTHEHRPTGQPQPPPDETTPGQILATLRNALKELFKPYTSVMESPDPTT